MDITYEVRRDGHTLATFTGYGADRQAFGWLLGAQPQSVHYATTYGGYSIVTVIDGKASALAV